MNISQSITQTFLICVTFLNVSSANLLTSRSSKNTANQSAFGKVCWLSWLAKYIYATKFCLLHRSLYKL